MKKIPVILGFLLLASPLWAADVGFNISIGAPGFYLSVGNFFGYPEREVVVIHHRGIPDDELPVVFFISRHAHVAPEVIIDLRVGYGWSWSRICAYYRIPPVVFYIPVERYASPHGHPYGHYRRHPHRRDWDRIRLTDAMIVNQVSLIFISKYYNYAPERIIRMREQGTSFGNIERKVYREKEYQARRPVPPPEMRRPGAPPETRRPIQPPEMHRPSRPREVRRPIPPPETRRLDKPPEMGDPQRWKEIPSQGVRSPNARFKDVYPSISHPSQRPEVKGGYNIEERGQGRGQGKKDKRGKD